MLIDENTSECGYSVEYGGDDPSYQTRTLKYLVKCLPLLDGLMYEKCLSLCLQMTYYLKNCVLKDGTLYSAFGSRNSEIIYPSGIIQMSNNYLQFADLANNISTSILNNITITPDILDFDNYIRLVDDYIDSNNKYLFKYLIIDIKSSNKFYPIKKIVKQRYTIYLKPSVGLPLIIFRDDTCVYKNSGILIRDKNNKFWGSQLTNGDFISRDNRFLYKGFLYNSKHQEMNTFQLLTLRILNFSLLKVTILGNIFRRYVVRKLMFSKSFKRFPFKRLVIITDDKLVVRDCLDFDPKEIKQCFQVPNMSLIHMASSRYSDNNHFLNYEIADKNNAINDTFSFKI